MSRSSTSMRLAAATACGLAAAPLFVAPASRSPVVTRLGVSDDVALRAATQAGASSTSSSVPLVAMGLVGAAAAASLSRRSSQVKRAAFDPTQELGIQAPVGFWDPLGFCDDGDEAAFRRRRAVEIKHGRVAMIATIGYIVPEYYRWPGDLSPSEGISFADVPNGFGAFSKVPMLGWAQIILFAGVMEGRFLSNETAPGDYGLGKYGALGLFGSVSDPEERKTKLNAEIANGRLAMFGIIGLFFQNGVTGTSGSEMYGFGENSAAVLLRIIVPVFIVLAITGENFRQGPGEKFLKFYERKDYFGKDRI